MTTLYIKNMVCDRCKKVLKDELNAIGAKVASIELGKIVLDSVSEADMSKINQVIKSNGFELIMDRDLLLVEQIKLFLISMLNQLPLQRTQKLSSLLAEELNKDYSGLSKLFSRNEHITIEKFFVRLKIEKVKELIQQGSHSFTEIANQLDYTNSSHLSKQFRDATGLSMTEYKKSNLWSRSSLDKII